MIIKFTKFIQDPFISFYDRIAGPGRESSTCQMLYILQNSNSPPVICDLNNSTIYYTATFALTHIFML